VTQARVEYVGSITIDEDLMDRVGLMEGERVLVVDVTNGARVETYVMVGERGSGVICMNGAAAHLIHKGDKVIIMGWELSDEPIEPTKILVDEQNRFERML
jgi:aspartate 1-decarboxylase